MIRRIAKVQLLHTLRAAAITFCLSLFLANGSHAEDWPAIIKQLKRTSSSREGKQQLGVAYNNYALKLSNDRKYNEAEAQLKKALQLDARNDQVKENLSVVLLTTRSTS